MSALFIFLLFCLIAAFLVSEVFKRVKEDGGMSDTSGVSDEAMSAIMALGLMSTGIVLGMVGFSKKAGSSAGWWYWGGMMVCLILGRSEMNRWKRIKVERKKREVENAQREAKEEQHCKIKAAVRIDTALDYQRDRIEDLIGTSRALERFNIRIERARKLEELTPERIKEIADEFITDYEKLKQEKQERSVSKKTGGDEVEHKVAKRQVGHPNSKRLDEKRVEQKEGDA